MDSSPIPLPAAPAPARRPPLPFIAAIVPVAAGVVLWLVSGSLYALCFAVLGPVMIAASLIDGVRVRRRERRSNEADADAAWARAEEELAHRQREVRARMWHRYPDVATCIAQPPLQGLRPPDAETEIVIGRGAVPSGIRSGGGDGERAREFERRCRSIADAPVRIALGNGLCIRGPLPVAAAVARGLLVQVCLRFGTSQVALVGDLAAAGMNLPTPHSARARPGTCRIGIICADYPVAVKLRDAEADVVIWLLPADTEVPPGVTTVLDVLEPESAVVRTADGIIGVAAEGVSRAQFEAILADRMDRGQEPDGVPSSVTLGDLAQELSPRGLTVAIGRGASADAVVDIVGDGPHAIVTGMTGAGKSELLVTWVTAIARAYGPGRVNFVLADFKGGTAFEPLRALRQVAAVITDLDEEGARRGVSSLRAELRRREAVLAKAGARDVSEVSMPRLVIVVDEFAALLQEHPDLGSVFTDVAARGRALGLHLILGTQRASGVIRDALAANCPLRIGLRVVDAADSRLMIGSTAAAEIPGGVESRGLAFLRRAQDSEPQAIRVASADDAVLREAVDRWADAEAPHSPWLPALPPLLQLREIAGGAGSSDVVVLGRADEPDRQRQPAETLRLGVDRGLGILGAPGSGRTTALRVLAAQHPDAQWVPADREAAWDLLSAWTTGADSPRRLVVCDDLDLLASGFPVDYAQTFLQRCEQVLRSATRTTFVLTASRASGPVGRVLDALPSRALLRFSSRVEHLAAGGEASGFLHDRPPGRARIGEREVQIAWIEGSATAPLSEDVTPQWAPPSGASGIVTTSPAAVALRLRAEYPGCEVIPVGGETPRALEEPALIVGDIESWQRNPAILQRIRAEGTLLFRVESPTDVRHVAGVRELLPYAHLHAGRAWAVRGDRSPQRVLLSAFGPVLPHTEQPDPRRAEQAPVARSRRELRQRTARTEVA
ncbi:FtsK/SpoIIIE domain-containing protein [Microbacterium sp.]|uniref:FtsK/SpoIIIE domain-containing protein n=1 Tax=Microbacterium sp. TaxID=51671 RepID=UPI002FE13C29